MFLLKHLIHWHLEYVLKDAIIAIWLLFIFLPYFSVL